MLLFSVSDAREREKEREFETVYFSVYWRKISHGFVWQRLFCLESNHFIDKKWRNKSHALSSKTRLAHYTHTKSEKTPIQSHCILSEYGNMAKQCRTRLNQITESFLLFLFLFLINNNSPFQIRTVSYRLNFVEFSVEHSHPPMLKIHSRIAMVSQMHWHAKDRLYQPGENMVPCVLYGREREKLRKVCKHTYVRMYVCHI